MRMLVLGSSGFVGSYVSEELNNSGHTVLNGIDEKTGKRVDLTDLAAINSYFIKTIPEVIINCSGVIDATGDFEDNIRFTNNILKASKDTGLTISNVIITGSAGEYGEVENLPVTENTPLKATSPYALSKIREEQNAIEFSETNNIPVTILRVFNPIGIGMRDRFLVPGFLRQIREYKQGKRDHIEVSRLDSPRDYIDARDVACAFRLVAEGRPKHRVYNIGSGKQTTNGEVLDLLIKNVKLSSRPKVIETSDAAEPQLASQADTSRIKGEFGWEPKIRLEQTIKDIADAAG